MASLREKLFLSIGVVLLAIAILGYLIPGYFIRKDIDNASLYLNQIYLSYLKKINEISSSLVSYRFIQTAAQLEAVSDVIKTKEESIWKVAGDVMGQDPEIAVVQVTNSLQQTAVISVESMKPHTPEWSVDSSGRLWIKFPEKGSIFLAQYITKKKEGGSYYVLVMDKGSEESKNLSFTPFDVHRDPASENESSGHETSHKNLNQDMRTESIYGGVLEPKDIYKALRLKETLLFQQMEMIKFLSAWEGKAAGILDVDSHFKTALTVLADEVFSPTPVVISSEKNREHPFVLYREKGPFVDLMQFATETQPGFTIAIGYSLSSIASEIAKTLAKPVLLSLDHTLLQGFTSLGENLPIATLLNQGKIYEWKDIKFIPYDIQLENLTFTILIPKNEFDAINKFLSTIKNSLVTKISLNLLSVALGLLIIALLVLARISKKITKPITQLARASEEIGKGTYEGLQLPPAEKRHDEVAILTHSFQKMVVSLRDREKIRGVLNKVVSKEIAAKILTSSIELGGEVRTLTMLFSDIRGFTHLSEYIPPQKVIALLNSYMTRMCRYIDETHGVVDKFVGDEIMALYGAPINLENHADRAVEAALLMIADLRKWNLERGSTEPQITVGIGIHTGEAFAGNMGAEDRLNYTVVGANVNLAARLCSVALPMQILISEATYTSISHPEKFTFRQLEAVVLKGIDEPVAVYEVF